MNRAAILQRLRSEAKAKQPTSTLTLAEVRTLLSIRTFVSIGPKGWTSRSPPTLQDCHQEWRTDRGQVVFRLREARLTWPRIAERLRVSEQTAMNYLALYRASIRQAQAAK